MFKGLVKVFWFNIILYLILIVLSYVLMVRITGSIAVSVVSVLIILVIDRLVFGGGLRLRKNIIKKLFSEFNNTTDEPLVDPDEEKWRKGIGFTDDVNQPMWIRIVPDGIVLYYLCLSRMPPYIIPWTKVSRLTFRKYTYKGESELLARLFIPGIQSEIFIPWDEGFNKYIPDFVSVLSIHN